MGKDKLLPCPFCGGSGVFDRHILSKNYAVLCNNDLCGCGTSYEYTKKDAKAIWNTRTDRQKEKTNGE